MNRITVFIPTYRRSNDLMRCLEALKKQTRCSDEVLVTVRDIDSETWKFLDEYNWDPLPLVTVTVLEPGVLAAHNAAYDSATGDIIAITDDDAEPYPEWLEKIEAYYLSDTSIGGVGGRDHIYSDGAEIDEIKCKNIGKVLWFGQIIGNHHLASEKAQEVDILKGVNCSYRKAAISNFRFSTDLRTSGANTHYEVALGLAVKKMGWKLLYDPNIEVNHYPGKRSLMPERGKFNPTALADTVHNETLILMQNFSTPRKFIFLMWSVLIGNRKKRGLVQMLRFLPREGTLSIQQWIATMSGRWQGLKTWKNAQHNEF